MIVAVEDLSAALVAGAQLLDVRWKLGSPAQGRADFERGHLPGAQFLDLETVLTGHEEDPRAGRHPLPSAEQLSTGLGRLGIDQRRPVIVYDVPGSFAAGRAWWVLTWAGFDVRVLDGGIIAWLSGGGQLETGPGGPVTPTECPVAVGALPTIDADQAADFAGTLIDARGPERFAGESEPVDPVAGHIPGAVNRPASWFFTESGGLPPAEVLRERLSLPDSPVAVYCGSGVSAAQVILALHSLGISAALYSASWSGWSADPDRAVAVGR